MKFVTRLRRIALWKKFTCLGLLCLALIAMPTALYWKEVGKSLAFAEKEQQGLPQVHLMLNIIQRTQQHRGLSARFLQDDSMSKDDRRSKAEELEAAIFAYDIYFGKHPNPVQSEAFAQLTGKWHEVHRRVSQKAVNPRESFSLHSALIHDQLQYLQSILDVYQLSLDPEADGYFLIEASLMRLPELTETLGKIRATGVDLLTKGSATVEERMQASALLLMSQMQMSMLDAGIKKAAAGARGDELIAQNYQAINSQYQKIRELTEREVLGKEVLSYSAEEFYAAFTFGLNSYFGYAHFAIDRLDGILNERQNALRNTMFVLLFYVFLLTLIVAFVCVIFIRRLLLQLGGEPYYATEVVQAITRGDLDCEIETEYTDSLLANVKRMREKLRESDRLKSEFVSTVSHELRTPLTAIGGALSLSISGQLGALPAPALKLLEIAQKNSQRLAELINDLLDIEKLSVGKLEMELEVQLLMPIVDDAISSMTSYAQKYDVHIVLGARYEYLMVNVDARRLRQVLVNFLSNAAKFSPRGEEIIINLDVSFDKVKVEVIDHGNGISESFHEKIFKKFSQADSSDSRSVGGTGLGLAIAKELIEKMNGTIGFVSTEGVGSCFYVELPLEEANSD
jgi:signal transduction histidine kinase